MYIQFKQGFIEVDEWDGSPVPDDAQIRAIAALRPMPVLVVRSREEEPLLTLRDVTMGFGRSEIFHTPKWDYPFRVYATKSAFGLFMLEVINTIDYRNFKNWNASHASAPRSVLAHDIWYVAAKMQKAPPRRAKATILVHSDGGPCHGTALINGRCPGCGIIPDMQSTALWSPEEVKR